MAARGRLDDSRDRQQWHALPAFVAGGRGYRAWDDHHCVLGGFRK